MWGLNQIVPLRNTSTRAAGRLKRLRFCLLTFTIRFLYNLHMRFLLILLLACAVWAQSAIYVVTHIDLMPAGTESGVAALKVFAAETLKDPGCTRFEILQQAGRPNHLTLVGIWKDQKA